MLVEALGLSVRIRVRFLHTHTHDTAAQTGVCVSTGPTSPQRRRKTGTRSKIKAAQVCQLIFFLVFFFF